MFCLILSVIMILRKIQNIGIIAEERQERRREMEIPLRKRRIRLISFGVGLVLILLINRQEHNLIRQTSVLENTMFFGAMLIINLMLKYYSGINHKAKELICLYGLKYIIIE